MIRDALFHDAESRIGWTCSLPYVEADNVRQASSMFYRELGCISIKITIFQMRECSRSTKAETAGKNFCHHCRFEHSICSPKECIIHLVRKIVHLRKICPGYVVTPRAHIEVVVQMPDKFLLHERCCVGALERLTTSSTTPRQGIRRATCMCRSHIDATDSTLAVLTHIDLELPSPTDDMALHGTRTRAEWLSFARLSDE